MNTPSPTTAAARTSALLSALALAAVLAGCAGAPSAPPANVPTGGTAAQAHARLLDAFNHCNEAAYTAAFAPLFTLVTSTTPQPVTSRDGLQRHLAAGCGRGARANASVVHQTARVSGNITVLVGQYRWRVAAAPGAAPVEVPQNFTVVFERMAERWMVLAHHVSVAP